MAEAIADYALLSDRRSAALVSRSGSIDWLCFPRFDSASLLGRLLGDEDHGHWSLHPTDPDARSTRRYDGDSFDLVTRWTTTRGEVEVTDFMPSAGDHADDHHLVRRVRGISGHVELEQVLRLRFDYAGTVPWVRQAPELGLGAVVAVAGPDTVVVRGGSLHPGEDRSHVGTVAVGAGDVVDLVMTYQNSHLPLPGPLDVDGAERATRADWRAWASSVHHPHQPWAAEVRRSLLVLRALTHADTGGIVAAATTSLPEQLGGVRNWDYRYVWLRDAALSIDALLTHGALDEAREWRDWLVRAIAGDPEKLQIMYGLAGERRLPEQELASLPGRRGSAPVRIGNGAYTQRQWDVYGEVAAALHRARECGLEVDTVAWSVQKAMLAFLARHWDEPDSGLWEIRGEPRMFTHSRVMVWTAFDRGVRAVEQMGLDGPVEEWRTLRDRIHADVMANGFDEEAGTFLQSYGRPGVDASLLMLPMVDFVAWDDPRMIGTIAAIEESLVRDGLVLRYDLDVSEDGLEGHESPFLICSFWLVEALARTGRLDEAHTMMDRLVATANDVGLLSEEFDPITHGQLGNTPQAFSHIGLVRAAAAVASVEDAAAPDSSDRR
ncbi:glycoside hydrolase family 15 protein [Auraticoccus monumenti]|uniref:Glucoamylase (Glucan-1,4-alpha-glucosidase), GH15 family n=1 Tax=Auraticoccus monumenti TaxID=675864 RepID=A0A1G6W221_9ACTN|nr:glycoside hydrolase family 15 protein [Auraticoccus monumenti]SDD59095.1 Glucoamylase (glucan-1,4-alpha-glucosidase), GH15 family [Auraticoccus monumenti]